MVRFTGDSFVLPSTARRGIPLVSVNIDSANLKLYRIGDRNIAPLLTSSQFLTQLDGYSAQRIQDRKRRTRLAGFDRYRHRSQQGSRDQLPGR